MKIILSTADYRLKIFNRNIMIGILIFCFLPLCFIIYWQGKALNQSDKTNRHLIKEIHIKDSLVSTVYFNFKGCSKCHDINQNHPDE